MKPLNFIDDTAEIGKGSVIWHFAVVMADVVLGENVSVGSCAEIGKGSVIGDDTRIGHGVFLPYNSRVGKRVFIAPGVYACDDKFPRVNHVSYIAMPPQIDDSASIGAGAILLPGVHIGVGAVIGAGAVVTHDVEAHSHVRGEPARTKALSTMTERIHQDIYAPAVFSKVKIEPNETHLLPT